MEKTDAIEHGAVSPFMHPGIKVNVHYMSTFVGRNLDKEPWKSAFEKVVNDYLSRGSKNWQPKPRHQVECGAYSNPDLGCTDETRDAQAAYGQALLWIITGDRDYAATSIRILDAWSANLTQGHVGENARLQASWAGSVFTCAAEILAHTDAGWSSQGQQAFKTMLKTQFQPIIEKLFYGEGWLRDIWASNWRATGIEALYYIAIHTDDLALAARSLQFWKDHLVAQIYLETDGPVPRLLPNWSRQPTEEEFKVAWGRPWRFIDGLNIETCRDFAHTAYGLASTINVAETALMHGIDLYQDTETQAEQRLTKAMELHCGYENIALMPDLSTQYSGFKLSAQWTFEIAYTHYAVRLGRHLPQTRAFIARHRPAQGDFHYMWETLTHGYPEIGCVACCKDTHPMSLRYPEQGPADDCEHCEAIRERSRAVRQSATLFFKRLLKPGKSL